MAGYLKVVLKNIEPLRIADDSSSQSGQTATLKYIPGTTIRGYVISRLAGEKDFESYKRNLFMEEVKFLNAYPVKNGKELIPTPKGFYEDKRVVEGKKDIQNVVINGQFSGGYKRASMGRFCHFQDDCIVHYGMETGSDMKIKMKVDSKKEQSVFRCEYMKPGNTFVSYIYVENEALKEKIRSTFQDVIILGNARTAGLGKCEIISCEDVENTSYVEYSPKEEQRNSCYMMLLSNTAMRNKYGEICGIDEAALGERLGVENLKIAFCSTSTVDVKGFNRVWGSKIPSVVMFEQGSVFKLTFDGTLTSERIVDISQKGIGIRKNEGFGQVLILEDYEKINYKMSGEKESHTIDGLEAPKQEDEKVLRNIARTYYHNQIENQMIKYVVEHPLKKQKISNSQLGTIQAFAVSGRYQPEKAKKDLMAYLQHERKKAEKNNSHKDRNSASYMESYINTIFSTELDELLNLPKGDKIMGISKADILGESEVDLYKLKLLIDIIRYDNKEGK